MVGAQVVKTRGGKRWIQKTMKGAKRGALHRQLRIPENEAIPLKTLELAAKAPGLLGKRARLALTLRKIRRKLKKGK
jgi:hypothetical protein